MKNGGLFREPALGWDQNFGGFAMSSRMAARDQPTERGPSFTPAG